MSQVRRRKIVVAVAALGCAGILGACGGESRPNAEGGAGAGVSGSVTGAATTPANGQTIPPDFGPDQAAATVAAALREFQIGTSVTELPAGKLFVTGTNMGEDTHELVITHAGAPDEEGMVAAAEDIKPGETKAVAADLAPGRYQFACYIKEDNNGTVEDHYQLGMVHEFEVK
ncbi:MAG: hypothetical protein U0U69_09345 [Acidimicrobiia bacterium]